MDEEGLKQLNRMGKSWFVLFKYHELIDHDELGWKNCKTVQMRKNKSLRRSLIFSNILTNTKRSAQRYQKVSCCSDLPVQVKHFLREL